MREQKQKKLTLELDSESEPISGRMGEENGTSRSFAGWLGLAAALGRVLGTRSEQANTDPAQTPESQSNSEGVTK